MTHTLSPLRRVATRVIFAAALLCACSDCRTRPYTYDDETGGTSPTGSSGDAAPITDAGDAGDIAVPILFDLTVPRDNCGVYSIQTTEIVRADLLLVQDRSGSMADGVNGQRNPPPGQSKWAEVVAAIEQVVSSTTTVNWGLMLFGTNRGCGFPATPNVPVGNDTATTIRQVLDITMPSSSTPTTSTLRSALAYFNGLNDNHPHYLLLATDGQPTCANGNGMGDDSAAAIAAVAAAAAAGVDTFVVGIGANTGADETLSAMAQAGQVPNTTPGQPAYYPVTSTQDLVTVLQKAALEITPCSYPVPPAPPDPMRVTIQSPDGVIPRDPTHQDGWDYSADGADIVFYGAACTQLKSGLVTSVQAVYGCPGDL